MTAMLTRDEHAALPTAIWSDWSCLVRLVVTGEHALEPASLQLQALMGQVERAASRFRSDSELCRANANAGRPVAISRTLSRLVDGALGAARRTNGAVDPTLGRDLVRLGYDRDITLIGDRTAEAAPRSADRGRWRDVRLDRTSDLLTVPAGTALDLGATAKAQTADWAATAIAQRYGCSVLVEIGGDLAVAGAKDDWQVTVAERGGGAGQRLRVHRGGVATSTTTVRHWRAGGAQLHHIVDPATGAPATGRWRTATVAAADALQANTCSTAAIVLGHDAVDWLSTQPVAARLVDRDGAISTVGGWPC